MATTGTTQPRRASTCWPAATSSTRSPRPVRSRASTTALPAAPGPSGIPEVPSSGLSSPPSSPPLAVLTASSLLHVLAETPVQRRDSYASYRSVSSSRSSSGASAASWRTGDSDTMTVAHRGGATFRIREECERFFCETMRATFHGETDEAPLVSGLTDVYHRHHHHQHGQGPPAPPADEYAVKETGMVGITAMHVNATDIQTWMELYDYGTGMRFRGFVAGANDPDARSLFVFFESQVVGRNLKKALIALMELAESPLGCAQMVICLDRDIPANEAPTLMKGLQWAGFSLTTLALWTGGVKLVSDRWLYMNIEL